MGDGQVNHEDPARPFLVMQAACGRASESFAVQQNHGSVQVVHKAHRGRGDTVAKWRRMVLRSVTRLA